MDLCQYRLQTSEQQTTYIEGSVIPVCYLLFTITNTLETK